MLFRVATHLHNWDSGRRIYEFVMTENVKCLLRNHRDAVVKPYAEQGIIDEQLLWSSTSFLALDEYYTRYETFCTFNVSFLRKLVCF